MSEWVAACRAGDIAEEDVKGFEHGGRVYCVYRAPGGGYHASDGLCTHEAEYLADGFVIGHIIECPRHNGRFDIRTGEAKGAPAVVDLRTYPVKVEDGRVLVDVDG